MARHSTDLRPVVSTRVSPEDLREIDAVADRMQAGRAEVAVSGDHAVRAACPAGSGLMRTLGDILLVWVVVDTLILVWWAHRFARPRR